MKLLLEIIDHRTQSKLHHKFYAHDLHTIFFTKQCVVEHTFSVCFWFLDVLPSFGTFSVVGWEVGRKFQLNHQFLFVDNKFAGSTWAINMQQQTSRTKHHIHMYRQHSSWWPHIMLIQVALIRAHLVVADQSSYDELHMATTHYADPNCANKSTPCCYRSDLFVKQWYLYSTSINPITCHV